MIVALLALIAFLVLLIISIVFIIQKRNAKPYTIAMAACVAVFFAAAMISTSGKEKTADASAPVSSLAYASRTSKEAEDVLKWQIEAALSTEKFDGYTFEIENDIVLVKVWRESIDRTFELTKEKGTGPDDENWVWLKNNTKNTSDYIADCIRTSELDNLQLQFHVVDSSSHEQDFFAIQNEEIVYDALAQ